MKPECNSFLHPQPRSGLQWKKARPLLRGNAWAARSTTATPDISSLAGVILQTLCALQRKMHSNGLKSSRDQCGKYRTKPIVCVFCKSKSNQGTGWRRGNRTNFTPWRKLMHCLCLPTATLFHKKNLSTVPCICVWFELYFACLKCACGKFHLILWSPFPAALRPCQS